jgi:acyl homoserine lactone synthase
MLYCVTQENNYHLPGNLMIGQHRLRYQAIIERQAWDVPSLRELEYDQYDTLAAVYIICADARGQVLGSARLCPTTRPYMLKEVFSHLVEGDLPASDRVWEGSRFCVDKNLTVEVRKRVQQELVYGYLEFALAHDIEAIIGVMHPAYWRNLFARNGWPVRAIGSIQKVGDGKDALAGSLPITSLTLASVQRATGITGSLLQFYEQQERKSA